MLGHRASTALTSSTALLGFLANSVNHSDATLDLQNIVVTAMPYDPVPTHSIREHFVSLPAPSRDFDEPLNCSKSDSPKEGGERLGRHPSTRYVVVVAVVAVVVVVASHGLVEWMRVNDPC